MQAPGSFGQPPFGYHRPPAIPALPGFHHFRPTHHLPTPLSLLCLLCLQNKASWYHLIVQQMASWGWAVVQVRHTHRDASGCCWRKGHSAFWRGQHCPHGLCLMPTHPSLPTFPLQYDTPSFPLVTVTAELDLFPVLVQVRCC